MWRDFSGKQLVASVKPGRNALWGVDNVTPSDWIDVALNHIELAGQRRNIENVVQWLHTLDVRATPNNVSVVRQHRSCGEAMQRRSQEIVSAIVSGASRDAFVMHLEKKSLSAMMGFIPEGNPFRFENANIPSGVYQSSRYSFAEKGKILQSAMVFYRKPWEHEKLRGFSDMMPKVDIDLSNVVRYYELELVYDRKNTILHRSINSGFVLYEGRSFVLLGNSLNIGPTANEITFKISDVKKAKGNFKTIADEKNVEEYRGVEVTSQSNSGLPGVSIIHLTREDTGFFLEESELRTCGIQFGYVSKGEKYFEELHTKLKMENFIQDGILSVG